MALPASSYSSESDDDPDWYLNEHEDDPDYIANLQWDYLHEASNREDLIDKREVPDRLLAAARIRHPHEIKIKGDPKLEGDKSGNAWEYVEYIPVWTDPDWNETEKVVEVKGEPTTISKRYIGDLWVSLRPAMRVEDTAFNPTEWATRFGLDPDVKNQGRSRLSPTISDRRRIPLPKSMMTPSGVKKNYIDISDMYGAGMEYHRRFGAESALSTMMGNLTATAQLGDGSDNSLIADALLRFKTLLDEDEDHQATWWSNLITEDLVRDGVVSFLNIGNSDLAGGLHPFLWRKNWEQPKDEGSCPDLPKYYYNLGGRRGRWDPKNDDLVWEAMQPALQMVSRVLYARPSSWMAFMNPYHLRRVPPERDQRKDLALTMRFHLCATWREMDINSMVPEAWPLYQDGFDFENEVMHILNHCLRFELISNLERDGAPKGHWAFTDMDNRTYPPTIPMDLDKDRIRIHLGVELIWGLLSPHYSTDEKINISAALATTIIHELGHATLFAQKAITDTPAEWSTSSIATRPGAAPVSDETLDKLAWLGDAYHPIWEPYWERDPETEAGFAVEQQIFGGAVTFPMENHFTSPHLLYTLNMLGFHQFPSANPAPHHPGGWYPDEINGSFLLGHHLPVDDIKRLVPLKMTRRYFDQAFWDHSMAKFGQVALRMQPKEISRAVISYEFMRYKDLTKVFGAYLGRWLAWVRTKMKEEEQVSLANYMTALLNWRLGATNVRKRWHWEKKTWPPTKEVSLAIVVNCNEAMTLFTQAFTSFTAPYADKQLILQDRQDEYRKDVAAGFPPAGGFPDAVSVQIQLEENVTFFWNAMMANFEDYHAFAVRQIQSLSLMTAEYLQLVPGDKIRIKTKYIDHLIKRIETHLHPTLNYITGHALSNFQLIDNAGHMTDDMRGMFQQLDEKLRSDYNHLDELLKLMKTDLNASFDNLRGRLTACSTRTHAERTRALRKSAARAFKHLDPKSDAVKAVNRWFDVFTASLPTGTFKRFDIKGDPEMDQVVKTTAMLNDIWTKAKEDTIMEDIIQEHQQRGIFTIPEELLQKREDLLAKQAAQREAEISGDSNKEKTKAHASDEELPSFNRPLEDFRNFVAPPRPAGPPERPTVTENAKEGFSRYSKHQILYPTSTIGKDFSTTGEARAARPAYDPSSFPSANNTRQFGDKPFFHPFAGRIVTSDDVPGRTEVTERIRRNFNLLGGADAASVRAADAAWDAAVRLLAFGGDAEALATLEQTHPDVAAQVRTTLGNLGRLKEVEAKTQAEVRAKAQAEAEAAAQALMAMTGAIFPPHEASASIPQPGIGPGAPATMRPLAGNLYPQPGAPQPAPPQPQGPVGPTVPGPNYSSADWAQTLGQTPQAQQQGGNRGVLNDPQFAEDEENEATRRHFNSWWD